MLSMLHSMGRIQVVLDSKLLRQADEAAKRAGVKRSALIRGALREHLRQIRIAELEGCDRRGYERHPDTEEDLTGWEAVASWYD